jgi:hypothetical protein
MALVWPAPSWSVLLRRTITRRPSGLGDILDVEPNQLGTPEAAGKAQQQDRAVARDGLLRVLRTVTVPPPPPINASGKIGQPLAGWLFQRAGA